MPQKADEDRAYDADLGDHTGDGAGDRVVDEPQRVARQIEQADGAGSGGVHGKRGADHPGKGEQRFGTLPEYGGRACDYGEKYGDPHGGIRPFPFAAPIEHETPQQGNDVHGSTGYRSEQPEMDGVEGASGDLETEDPLPLFALEAGEMRKHPEKTDRLRDDLKWRSIHRQYGKLPLLFAPDRSGVFWICGTKDKREGVPPASKSGKLLLSCCFAPKKPYL